MINDQACFSFAFFQVLEYHPHPWNQWVHIGDLVKKRFGHATLSIGPEQLPCLSTGGSFKIEMIIKTVQSTRLINKQRSYDNDNDVISNFNKNLFQIQSMQ